MSNVLIWKKVSPGSEYDIFRGVDAEQEYLLGLKNGCYNIGNRLWLQGIMSAIDTQENKYDFLPNQIDPDRINVEYDFIILPMANIFNEKYLSNIRELADIFAKIRIPIYIIACGAQASSYEALDELIEKIGEESKRFIGAVYEANGEFGLRGNFTKEFFDRLGFPSAVVTGCPSLYQFGRDFSVCSGRPSKADVRPVFNGKIDVSKRLLDHFNKSHYMDQDMFWTELYAEKTQAVSFRTALACYANYGIGAMELLADDRVRLIPDMYNWKTFLTEQGYNYAFGTRIHGNIMAILAGIPATVIAMDSRTREMAEFFDIPFVLHEDRHVYTVDEFYHILSQADYTKFNESFRQKYDCFAAFLTSHGIVSKINSGNTFFAPDKKYSEPPAARNQEFYQDAVKLAKNYRGLMELGCFLSAAKSRILNGGSR